MDYTEILLPAAILVWIVVSFVQAWRLPSVPGPVLARWSHYWLLFKVWKGDFERWEIDAHATHGSVVRVSPDSYSIDSPEAAKKIYSIHSKMAKSDFYRAFGDPTQHHHNLFATRDRAFHVQMKKRMAGLYSMTTIKSYEEHVNDCIAALLRNFDQFAQTGKIFDVQKWMQYYAFDVIGKISWGKAIGFLDNGGQDVENIISRMSGSTSLSSITGISMLAAPIGYLLYGNPVGGIASFVKLMESHKSKPVDDQTRSSQGLKSFSQKLDAAKQESPQDFEVYNLKSALTANVAAGSDTTSISLTAVLALICENPRVLLKLQEELQAAIAQGNVDSPIRFDQAVALPYFQHVIKEALRMHPAVGLPLWRVVDDPAGFEIDGTVLPPKSIVGINPWVAHANKSVYGEDVAEFRPERWDPEYTSKEQLAEMEHYYMPFGMGTRTCIGRHIAYLEICKLVPELIRRYDLQLQRGLVTRNNHFFVMPKGVTMKLARTVQ